MTRICELRAVATRVPCVSLLLSAVAVVLYFLPDVVGDVQYDRAALATGQLWRVVTCHLTHWSLDHLVWDVGALIVLGTLCEVAHRRAFTCCVAVSAVWIPLALWICLPDVSTYRGLSGIDAAAFVLLAVTILGESLAVRQLRWAAACTIVLLAFTGKVCYECVTDATLFVDSAAAGMTPIPLAHVVGGCVGAILGAGISLGKWATGPASAAYDFATKT